MWLLHFIFEGLLFYFFKTAEKDVALRIIEMTKMSMRSDKSDFFLKKEKAVALIAFEDASGGRWGL